MEIESRVDLVIDQTALLLFSFDPRFQAADVGYLGDLRIDPQYRNGTLAARLYRSLQRRDTWCDWYRECLQTDYLDLNFATRYSLRSQ